MLLLIKSLYTLSLFYFGFPFLQANPLKLCLFLSLFNYIFALLLRLRQERLWKMIKSLVLNLGIASFFVVVAGGNPFSLKTWAFSSLLSSVCFFESLKDAQLLANLYHLRISSLASSNLICLFSTLGALVGSLLTGLIVILDWDVTWQKFPIPNAIGCIFGELCGTLLGTLVLKYKLNNKSN